MDAWTKDLGGGETTCEDPRGKEEWRGQREEAGLDSEAAVGQVKGSVSQMGQKECYVPQHIFVQGCAGLTSVPASGIFLSPQSLTSNLTSSYNGGCRGGEKMKGRKIFGCRESPLFGFPPHLSKSPQSPGWGHIGSGILLSASSSWCLFLRE